MLLDVRTYTCRPGTIKKHLALYEKLGYELFGTLDGYPPGYRQFYLRKLFR